MGMDPSMNTDTGMGTWVWAQTQAWTRAWTYTLPCEWDKIIIGFQ